MSVCNSAHLSTCSNFSYLGGIFLSKVKKAICLLLAAAMLMSVLPVSGLAYLQNPDGTEYSEANGDYAYGTDVFANPTGSTIWVDTLGTTEIIRIGAVSNGATTCEYGNTVVKATPSGMPEVNGNYSPFFLGGETPASPVVKMRVYGIDNANRLTGLSITSENLNNAQWGTPQSVRGSTTIGNETVDYVDFTWTLTNPYVATASGPDVNVRHVITFGYNNKTYTQYAYSHTEYILHPNGVNYYLITKNITSTNGRISAFGAIVGANMKPGYASSTTSNQRGYMNGQQGSSSADSVPGLGSEGPVSSDGLILKKSSNGDNNHSTLYYIRDSYRNYSSAFGISRTFSTSATDGNRTLTTVWVDKATDVLGNGQGNTYSKPNNLNMRFLFMFAENKNFYIGCIYCFQLRNSNSEGYGYTGDKSNGTPSGTFTKADALTINTNQWVAESGKSASFNADNRATLKNKGISNNATLAANENVAAGVGFGQGGYLLDRDTKVNYGYLQIALGGIGPTASQTGNGDCWSLNCTGYGQFENRDLTSNSNRATTDFNMSVRFRVYDTSMLRAVIDAIDTGNFSDGATFTYGGTYGSSVASATHTITKNKGANPQSFTFYSGWNNFITAYNTARQYIASFDLNLTNHSYNGVTTLNAGIEQTAIDQAITSLINAYNNLGYQDKGKITVHHYLADNDGNPVLEGGNPVKVVPDEVYYGFDSQGNPTKVEGNVSEYFIPGVSFTLFPLNSLRGYECTTTGGKAGYAMFSGDGTTYGVTALYDASGNSLGSEYAFYYKPAAQNLIIHPNNEYEGLYTTTVLTGAVPDFAAIKTAIGGKLHCTYVGMYEDAAFTGSAVTESGTGAWTMPNSTANLFVKWNPKPIKIHVNAIDESGNPVTLSGGTDYSSEYVMQSLDEEVSFADGSLSTPVAPAGYDWGQAFYSDAACENPVEWPITAKYEYGEGEEYTYTINETGSGTAYNTIEVYTQFANNNNKITFYAMGGKLDDNGNEVSSKQITFTTGTPVSYLVPVREGYNFLGWFDGTGDNANPINDSYITGSFTGAWTGYADGSFYPVENGTITMSTTVGFNCYAKWEPKEITGTYRLRIGSNEVSPYNSKASKYPPFTVRADQLSSADDAPATPRRYGYLFKYWIYDGRTFTFGRNKYPLDDFELTADWEPVDDVAYADITTYVRQAGTDYIVDEQHAGDSAEIDAARGDVVSVKFTVSGKFFSGSQAYVFGYNQDFYEEISGVSLFDVNEDNPFISEIAAEVNTVTQFNPQTQARFTNIDPYTGETVNARYVEITIDPDVYTTGNYNTASMDQMEYLLVLHLRIKDTATGTGSVWVATEALRQADNMAGPMFISWNNTQGPLTSVETYRVDFDTNVMCSSVTVDPLLEYDDYTLTAAMPTKGGTVQGEFDINDSTKKTSITYTGREGAEILETYTTAGGVSSFGVPEAVKEGYHVSGWYAGTVQNGETVYDETDEWIPGFYATYSQDGGTYYAKWAPNEQTLTFYEKDKTTLRGTVAVEYDQVGVTDGVITYRSGNTEEFIGWIPMGQECTESNIVDFTTYHVTGDASFYPWVKPTQKSIIIKAYIPDPEDSNAKIEVGTYTLDQAAQETFGLEIRYGDNINIVDVIPANPESNITYITYSQIDDLMQGNPYTSVADGSTVTPAAGLGNAAGKYELADTTRTLYWEVNESNSANPALNTNIIYVEYQGAIVREIFRATGAFVNTGSAYEFRPATYTGDITYHTATIQMEDGDLEMQDVQTIEWYVEGRYGSTYDFDAATAGVVAPFGFESAGWDGPAAAYRGVFRGSEYNAMYTARSVTVTFINTDGITPIAGGSSSTQRNPINKNYDNGYFSRTNFNYYGNSQRRDDKVGYDYQGWAAGVLQNGVYVPADNTIYGQTNTNVYIASINSSYYVEEDGVLKLYMVPYFTPKTINITYNTVKEDGSAVTQIGSAIGIYNSTYRVGNDAQTGRLTIPEITGYTVKNINGDPLWYKDINDLTGTNYDVDNTVVPVNTEDPINYYAVYEANTYKVDFNANGGAWADSSTTKDVDVKYEQTITAPDTAPTKAGHTLAGWATSATATEPLENLPTLTTVGDHTTTLYAVWAPNLHTVTYKLDAADTEPYEVISNVPVGATTIPTPATNPTKTGYTFQSWNGIPASMPDEDITVTANWTVNKHDVVYKVDGVVYEQYTGANQVDYGAVIPVPATDPTKTGWTFTGWTPDAPATMPDNDLEFNATFTQNNYTITYRAEGEQDIVQTYHYQDVVTAPAEPTRTGYTFSGWQNVPATMPAEDVIITGTFTVNTYNVIYKINSDDAEPYETITNVAYGTAAADIPTPATNPTKTGFNFEGWLGIPATMPAMDVTVIADWTENDYTVTYVLNNGQADITQTYHYQDTITAPASPEKTGYTFGGWSDGTDTYTSAQVSAMTMPADNITFTAQWTAIDYTVTYVLNNGQADITQTYHYQDTVTAPADPSRTGYTFTGWDNVPATMPADNVTVTAQWRINEYTITYVLGNGEENVVQTYNYGAEVTAAANPAKDGYNFTDWDITIPATMPAQNLVATAQWSSHHYVVTFNYGQGAVNVSAPASTNVTYTEGVTVTLPDHNNYGAFYKTGWNFKGWYTTQADAEAANDNYISGSTWAVPAQSADNTALNLYAGWTQNTYQITFDTVGGSTVATMTKTYGEEITRPADPTKDGYDFAGWYENGTAFTAWTTMPARNIALTAQWTDHVYDDNQVVFVQPDDACLSPTYHGELTYNDHNPFESGNGTIWNDVEVTRGQGLPAYPTDVPELTNYRFMYWQCSADNAIYTADGTYVDADGVTQNAQTFASFVMPDLANDTVVYFTAVYYRVEVSLEIQTTSDAAKVDKGAGEPEAVTGYIYNVGEKQTKAKLQNQLEVEGDGYITYTPSKMNVYGTGAKIELYSNRNDAPSNAEPIETYYIIVFGDVDGSAHCNSSDVALIYEAIEYNEADRTWELQQSASMLSNAEKIRCACYNRAADVDGDNDVDELDANYTEGYVMGYFPAYEFDYNSETKKGHYQILTA